MQRVRVIQPQSGSTEIARLSDSVSKLLTQPAISPFRMGSFNCLTTHLSKGIGGHGRQKKTEINTDKPTGVGVEETNRVLDTWRYPR